MNRFFRNSLIAASAIVAGTCSFMEVAKADDADVNFSGDVANICVVSNPVNGTLEYDSATQAFSSETGAATAASLDYDCNNAATVTYAVTDPGTNPATLSPTVTGDAAVAAAGTGTLEIDLALDVTGGVPAPGTYAYTVNVDVTAN